MTTPRQAYALEHVITDPRDLLDPRPYQGIRRHASGLLLLSTLAVDR